MINILITGSKSYIGESVCEYLMAYPEKYTVQIKDTMMWEPNKEDFAGIDVVFNVAGIAHIKETSENRHLYFDINRDLVIKIAREAKNAGVRQFILLSTMSVYGKHTGIITKTTPVNPINAYGKSKAEADEVIGALASNSFKFACLRPPMVYGRDCKGNYQKLRKFALKSPLFPNYHNQRSMVYIGNLCEFVKECIDFGKEGIFFPQNAEYTDTSEMVRRIAEINGKKIKLTSMFNWIIKNSNMTVVRKVFGDLIYDKVDVVDKYSLSDSLLLTEGK